MMVQHATACGADIHLQSAAEAAQAEIDEAFMQELLALRPAAGERTWMSGLEENNAPVMQHGAPVNAASSPTSGFMKLR